MTAQTQRPQSSCLFSAFLRVLCALAVNRDQTYPPFGHSFPSLEKSRGKEPGRVQILNVGAIAADFDRGGKKPAAGEIIQ